MSNATRLNPVTTAERTRTAAPQQKVPTHDHDADVMVRLRGVHRHYGAVHAMDGIDLDVCRGQFLVLLGPSGSGKSTLIRALAGIESIDAGEVAINGTVVSQGRVHLPPEQRNLGMVFQDYALWPHMTVAQNVAYPLKQRRTQSGSVRPRVTEMLERVGLASMATRYPNELSGGQQQRVALARALVGRPPLVLFDEPLSNLDADLRERLRVEISGLVREQGATAIYITHDQREAFALADRVGVLNFGKLVQWGTPEDIYHDPTDSFVARFTGVAGSLTGMVTSLLPESRCEVHLDGANIVCRAAPGLAVGAACEVQVRPTASRLADDRLADDRDPAGHDNRLSGTVADVAYRGALYDHVVNGPWGSLVGVPARVALDRGVACTIRLSSRGMLAFPVAADAARR